MCHRRAPWPLLVVLAAALVAAGCGSDPEPLSRADEPRLVELCVAEVDDEEFCQQEVERLGIAARVKGCTYDQTAAFLTALLRALEEEPPDTPEVNRLADRFNDDCSI